MLSRISDLGLQDVGTRLPSGIQGKQTLIQLGEEGACLVLERQSELRVDGTVRCHERRSEGHVA
jgi:hypothetical protein